MRRKLKPNPLPQPPSIFLIVCIHLHFCLQIDDLVEAIRGYITESEVKCQNEFVAYVLVPEVCHIVSVSQFHNTTVVV